MHDVFIVMAMMGMVDQLDMVQIKQLEMRIAARKQELGAKNASVLPNRDGGDGQQGKVLPISGKAKSGI